MNIQDLIFLKFNPPPVYYNSEKLVYKQCTHLAIHFYPRGLYLLPYLLLLLLYIPMNDCDYVSPPTQSWVGGDDPYLLKSYMAGKIWY